MGFRLVLVWTMLTWGLTGCDERRPLGADGAVADAGTDAPADAVPVDSGRSDAGVADTGSSDAGRTDGGSVDSGPDARTDSGSDARVDGGADGGALDPRLSPAGPEGEPCDTPGSSGECPFVQVCRFFDATTSRCESCEPCGNLNAPCSASDECDILFMCFAGRCTNICPLGTSFCGPPDDCIDVGHPTHGVCRPF